eukprot:c18875_g1_i2.p1 GENE.c18875_g1_i2~~c18875_g1_i2.p1  ORF type:complete len:148 (+),score=13.05 c18875_g1_i2:51-494(+)
MATRLLALIPHRTPFVFLDRVIANDTLQSSIVVASSVFRAAPTDPARRMHHDLLLVEAMGQAGCLILKQMDRFRDQTIVFTQLKNISMPPSPEPYETVEIHARVTKFTGARFGTVQAEAVVGSATIASAELGFAGVPDRGYSGKPKE